ncbi:hypothetical protein AAVH_32413 [Aphelenchoides avenae]|nr:hypothetical protein AAVH_32413 [Aphelenchus avenae]
MRPEPSRRRHHAITAPFDKTEGENEDDQEKDDAEGDGECPENRFQELRLRFQVRPAVICPIELALQRIDIVFDAGKRRFQD